MRRAPKSAAEEYYTFFIRHTKPNDFLIVKDITITAPENIGDWTVISGVSDVKYALGNLQGGTEYEVMVQPVYDSGLIGAGGPITVFSTLGEDTDPLAGVFSISEEKKVSFAKGNLRYDGDAYEGTWSIAPQQYDVLGESNIEYSGSEYSYPATLHDMFCWSTASNSYGVSNYYYYDEEAALPYFLGDFADWGESPTLIADLGTDWTTLTVDEWNYLLNERDNAAQLRTIATVAGVKGLVLLPDQWEAPAGVLLSDDMSSGEWSAAEQAGAVFLPAAGQLTTTYEDYRATTTLTEAATYWTATPSDDESGMKAMVLTIGDNEVTLTADLNRRVGTAVRLVKPASQAEPGLKGDLTGDGSVDGSDVSALLEMVLEGGLTDAQKAIADLTGDGDVDGSDISALLEIVLSGE